MSGKEIAILVVFIIFGLPSLLGLMFWTIKATANPNNSDNINQGAKLMADEAVPWWLGVLSWLAGLPGLIGAGLVIGFIFFLKWIGEIR